MDMHEMNQQIIAEYREKAGKLGGMFEGAPMLLLHTTGARSGAERINPLMFQPVGDTWAVFASKGGAPSHPDWYYNVLANSEASIELGSETVAVRARVADGAEHDGLWSTQKERVPQFADYEKTANRKIPVIVLERR